MIICYGIKNYLKTISVLAALSLNTLTVNRVKGQSIGLRQTPEQQSVTRSAGVKRDSLSLVDPSRNRLIPVALYDPVIGTNEAKTKQVKRKLAIINHGYGGKNTAYSFIANNLVAHGYVVASIQHELPGDEPLPKTGKPYETRMPNWKRGVQNIQYVIQELKRRRPELDVANLLLVGHSNGGDMAMLFATEHPDQVKKVITLDNRRMPFPRTRQPQILSLRSSDQPADEGVLPTPAEQEQLGTKIVKLPNTIHNDMWDGATEEQKREMIGVIEGFVGK